MSVTKSQANNITSPSGNSLAVFIDGVTGVMLLKDINGQTEPILNYVGKPSPFEYNSNATGIQPILGNNVASGNYAVIGAGANNSSSGNYSSILGGENNNTNNYANAHIIGSGITATKSDGTFTNCISAQNLIAGCGVQVGTNGFLIPVPTTPLLNNIFIIGAGTGSTERCGLSNQAVGNYSVVTGGKFNCAFGNFSTISGGICNCTNSDFDTIAGGQHNVNLSNYSIIGGGSYNTTSGSNSAISGGLNNVSSNNFSLVGGGSNNVSSAPYSIVSGGSCNIASAEHSFVGGGYKNNAIGIHSVISGGAYNCVSGSYSSVLGGCFNLISGYQSSIVGGHSNCISNKYGFIGNGYNNNITGTTSFMGGGRFNTISGNYGVIGGGDCNTASGACSFIGGGYKNTASGSSSSVVGGQCNIVSGNNSFIAGGTCNNVTNNYSFIGAGENNTASGSMSFVGGGGLNTASGSYSFLGGGKGNTASGSCSGILGGQYNNTCTFADSMIIGSNLCATQACTTFMNCASVNNLTVGCLVSVGANKVLENAPFNANYGLFAQTSDSTPVTATTVESSIIGSGVGALIVPANGFSVGSSFDANLEGILSAVGTATLEIRVKTLSGALLMDTGVILMATTTNKKWTLSLQFTVRQVGTAGVASISSGGLFSYIKNASSTFEGFTLSTVNNTTFDTTISNTLVVTAQWNTTNAGNSIFSRNFVLNKIY